MIKALTYVQMYGLWSLTVDYLVVFVAGSHVDFLELYFLVFNLKSLFYSGQPVHKVWSKGTLD